MTENLWTDDLNLRLTYMVDSGYTELEIGRTLNRSAIAIRTQSQKLGLRLKRDASIRRPDKSGAYTIAPVWHRAAEEPSDQYRRDMRFQQALAKSLVEGHDMPSGYKGGRWQWLRDTGRIGLVGR